MPTQQEILETRYSQRNIHQVLHECIRDKLDQELLNWALGCFLRIDTYLEKEYYPSKDTRIAELQAMIDENGLEDLIIDTLISVIRSHRNQTIQQCIGYLATHMPHLDPFDCATTAGELLSLCATHNGLFSIRRPRNDEAPLMVMNYWDLMDEMFGEQFAWIDTTFFNPPLLKRPKKVEDNRNCGYHSIQEPLILGSKTMHSDQLNYTVINNLNALSWVLDQDVLAEPEAPPTPLRTVVDHQNYIKHCQQTKEIEGILQDRPFFIAWQYDSRGRIYSHGHHVHFQSHERKKASLSFAHHEVLTT